MKEESDLRGDRGTRMLGKDDAFTRRELVLIEQWLASQNNTSAPNRSTDKKQRKKKKGVVFGVNTLVINRSVCDVDGKTEMVNRQCP